MTQDNIAMTICHSGYSSEQRATIPTSYFANLKRQQMIAYASVGRVQDYEEDHLISIELGGALDDPRNLWPENGASPNPKDAIENHLHSLVCAGMMTLSEAQRRIAIDWRTAVQ